MSEKCPECPAGIYEPDWRLCFKPIPLDEAVVNAFRGRQEKLLRESRWPMSHWYHDADFCRAMNTAIGLQAANEQLWIIVKKLADSNPDFQPHNPAGPRCFFCRAKWPYNPVGSVPWSVPHAATCLWRLAREVTKAMQENET